jgi:anti-sigma B factor antagonist
VNLDLDLSTLSFLDSSGLGTLVGIHRLLSPHDGRVRLWRPKPALRQLLRLVHLDEIFEIVP